MYDFTISYWQQLKNLWSKKTDIIFETQFWLPEHCSGVPESQRSCAHLWAPGAAALCTEKVQSWSFKLKKLVKYRNGGPHLMWFLQLCLFCGQAEATGAHKFAQEH